MALATMALSRAPWRRRAQMSRIKDAEAALSIQRSERTNAVAKEAIRAAFMSGDGPTRERVGR